MKQSLTGASARGVLRSAAEKLRRSRGFTMSEMLVVTIILLLATGVAAESFPVVRNVYVAAVDSANAQAMMNNATIMLRNELCLATYEGRETTSEDRRSFVGITYTDVRTGYQSRITSEVIGAGGGSSFRTVMISEYANFADFGASEESVPRPRPLIFMDSEAGGPQTGSVQTGELDSGMLLSFDDASYDEENGAFVFENLCVSRILRKDGALRADPIITLPLFRVHTANPGAAPET